MNQLPPPLDAGVTDADMEFRFRGGRLCLYLVETFGEWTNRRFDRVPNAELWAAWLAQASLPLPSNPVNESDLTRMRELRTSLYRLAHARRQQQAFDPEDVRVVNHYAQQGVPLKRLTLDGDGVFEAPVLHLQVLGAIAFDAIELFSGPHGTAIKQCDDAGCPTLFVDTSRGQNRRWCSSNCGARNATASYRRRHLTPRSV